jgi:prepilin signal peptidase PulO-like enzyme (type II secretory pathway)
MITGLIIACLIDLDHYIIPDRFSLGGCVAGFIACAIDPSLMYRKTALEGFSWSLASAMIGALSLLALAWLGTVIFKKEAMGMGDVKFLAAMCAFLGGTSITWILPLSALRRRRPRPDPDCGPARRVGHPHPLRPVPRTGRHPLALWRFQPDV